jgi:tRNA A37 threonylcarbamoyladenosine synthetase subunit TsaC/SUA5/YrdC
MSEPSLVVRLDEHDTSGNLRPEHVDECLRVLRSGGFVMLPSDTAYSVAAWLHSTRTRRQVNALLDREDEPISFAFPSPEVVRRWIAKNDTADRLLKRFAPGPITVVCRASPLVPAIVTKELMGSLNHTVGVRISGSVIEQQVAGIGASVITTVPVLDLKQKSKPPVASFEEAVAVIQARIGAFNGKPWCAIEGVLQHPRTSTVVEVLSRGGSYTIKRPGVIPAEDIRAFLDDGQNQAGS